MAPVPFPATFLHLPGANDTFLQNPGGGVNWFIEKFAVVVVPLALLVLILEGDLLSPSPVVIAGQLAGLFLLVSSRAAFRHQQFKVAAEPGDGPLIHRGPYRVLRHPIYAGALLFLWSTILGHWSLPNGSIGVIVLVVVVLRIAAEEALLRQRYADYGEYAQRTKRIIPFLY
jgi:protein-S-isoprenylcysteine O-methyltransferase Ste14